MEYDKRALIIVSILTLLGLIFLTIGIVSSEITINGTNYDYSD